MDNYFLYSLECVKILKQLFASGSVIFGEYSPRLRDVFVLHIQVISFEINCLHGVCLATPLGCFFNVITARSFRKSYYSTTQTMRLQRLVCSLQVQVIFEISRCLKDVNGRHVAM